MARPVSYTHLDVYKRQTSWTIVWASSWCGSARLTVLTIPSSTLTCSVAVRMTTQLISPNVTQIQRSLLEKPCIVKREDQVDVYKRQVYSCSFVFHLCLIIVPSFPIFFSYLFHIVIAFFVGCPYSLSFITPGI